MKTTKTNLAAKLAATVVLLAAVIGSGAVPWLAPIAVMTCTPLLFIVWAA